MLFPQKWLVVTVNLLLWTDVAVNMRGWFPSFHNGVKKLPIVTWRGNGKCMALIIQFSISIEKIQQNPSYEENWYPGLQDWYPYFFQSMGGFLPSDSHPLWYLCLIKWERTARMSFPINFSYHWKMQLNLKTRPSGPWERLGWDKNRTSYFSQSMPTSSTY